MTWDKPKSGKGWLLLFAPAGVSVGATVVGGLVAPNGDWIGWALVGLLVATVGSLGLSIWLARVNASAGDKFACALICFLILMLVNGAVSFAGCAVGFGVLPRLSFE